MTTKAKRRVVFVFLVAFGAWPMVHHGIVRAFDLSPWKLFGWAMYCTPPRTIDGYIFGIENGRRVRALDPRRLDEQSRADLERAADQFGRRRAQLHRFIRPDDLAEVIFRHFPQEHEIEIELHRHFIDRGTARVKSIVEEPVYRYARDQFQD